MEKQNCKAFFGNETYGILVYQEDITKVSMAAGRARAELLWSLYLEDAARPEVPRIGRSGAAAGRAGDQPDLVPTVPVAAPEAPEYDRATMLRHEVETLGFLLSAHPLSCAACGVDLSGVRKEVA